MPDNDDIVIDDAAESAPAPFNPREHARKFAHERLGGNPEYDAAVLKKRQRILEAISRAYPMASTLAGEVIEEAKLGLRYVLEVSHRDAELVLQVHELENFKPGRWRKRRDRKPQDFITLRYAPEAERWHVRYTPLAPKLAKSPAGEFGSIDDALRTVAEYIALKLRPDHEWASEA